MFFPTKQSKINPKSRYPNSNPKGQPKSNSHNPDKQKLQICIKLPSLPKIEQTIVLANYGSPNANNNTNPSSANYENVNNQGLRQQNINTNTSSNRNINAYLCNNLYNYSSNYEIQGRRCAYLSNSCSSAEHSAILKTLNSSAAKIYSNSSYRCIKSSNNSYLDKIYKSKQKQNQYIYALQHPQQCLPQQSESLKIKTKYPGKTRGKVNKRNNLTLNTNNNVNTSTNQVLSHVSGRSQRQKLVIMLAQQGQQLDGKQKLQNAPKERFRVKEKQNNQTSKQKAYFQQDFSKDKDTDKRQVSISQKKIFKISKTENLVSCRMQVDKHDFDCIYYGNNAVNLSNKKLVNLANSTSKNKNGCHKSPLKQNPIPNLQSDSCLPIKTAVSKQPKIPPISKLKQNKQNKQNKGREKQKEKEKVKLVHNFKPKRAKQSKKLCNWVIMDVLRNKIDAWDVSVSPTPEIIEICQEQEQHNIKEAIQMEEKTQNQKQRRMDSIQIAVDKLIRRQICKQTELENRQKSQKDHIQYMQKCLQLPKKTNTIYNYISNYKKKQKQ